MRRKEEKAVERAEQDRKRTLHLRLLKVRFWASSSPQFPTSGCSISSMAKVAVTSIREGDACRGMPAIRLSAQE